MMHRCLLVDEIVRNVAFCKDVLRGASLLNMALTCKAFYEPAMDALWERMGPDLKPILLLLPSQCVGWTEGVLRRLMFLKVPDISEWDRVRHYAKRVRYWTVDDLRLFNYQIKGKEGLPGLASPFLFPYLRQLNAKEVTSRTINSTLLMPPSLQNVQLQLVYPKDVSILPFVRQLSSCQSLRTLILLGGASSRGSSSPVMEDIFADSLLRLRRLEAVRVDWLSLQPRALAHLASLEHLQDLAFWVKGSEGLFDGPSYTSNAFQALKRLSLSVTARNSDGLLSLLHAFPKVQLRELSVRLDSCANSTSSMHECQWPSCEPTTSGAPSKRYMKRLTLAIAAAQFPSLQVLKIIVYTLSWDFELIFSESCLSSLLSLRGLTELDIGECPVYHIPDFFRIVASTWPCLQVLHVGGPAEDVPPFGVADLLPLVDCRELRTLGVYLDDQVSSVDVARRPPPGTSQSPLRVIHLRNDKVEDVENFALFLHSTFPLADVHDRAYDKMVREISINQQLARLRAATAADVQGANEKGSK